MTDSTSHATFVGPFATLRLERVYSDVATTGTLRLPSGRVLHSLELPWRDNKRNQSCIPEGRYTCHPDNTGRHRFWRVPEVPGRSNIELHPVNHLSQLGGCVAFGMRRKFRTNPDTGIREPKIVNARKAFAALLKELGREPFVLEIVEAA